MFYFVEDVYGSVKDFRDRQAMELSPDPTSELTEDDVVTLATGFLYDDLSGDSLDEHPWATMEGAYGECYIASDAFVNWLRRRGYQAELVAYSFPEEENFYPVAVVTGYKGPHHTAMIDNRFVVDLTARQFNDAADFPAVWPVEETGIPKDSPCCWGVGGCDAINANQG